MTRDNVAERGDTRRNKDVLVIGAGLHGLVTAKALLHDSNDFFDSVTIYEKNNRLGGVWSEDRIYEGLTTNSPLLTYEIPEFPYPEKLRSAGGHVAAQDVNRYFHAYAEQFGISKHVQYQTLVEALEWEPESSAWVVQGKTPRGGFQRHFGYIVVCVGLYHTGLIPLAGSQTSSYAGNIWHSSEMGNNDVKNTLANSQEVIVSGAGKSALDISTLLAQGKWTKPNCDPPNVTLVYRRPHWLSPRKIVRGTVAFEKLLFSRFVSAWLPFVRHPDAFHRLIADTWFGRWSTNQIFDVIADDFVKSLNQQDLPQTIPKHSLAVALSGALHVEPPGFIDCVRDGRIKIVEGSIVDLEGKVMNVKGIEGSSITVEADNILMATGYKLALPFFSDTTLRDLGLLRPEEKISDNTDLPYIRLYRVIAPPSTVNPSAKGPYRNIAFNGFAYSLLNPTVAHVTANWICDYFAGVIASPDATHVEQEINDFHAWQAKSFGPHGAKGVHIGPHATLYSDVLLADMGLQSGHVQGNVLNPLRFFWEWFRPMYPSVYSGVAADRRIRGNDEIKMLNMDGWDSTTLLAAVFVSVLLAILLGYLYLG